MFFSWRMFLALPAFSCLYFEFQEILPVYLILIPAADDDKSMSLLGTQLVFNGAIKTFAFRATKLVYRL